MITGERISISATEQLCEDCWPFFLLPQVEGKVAAPERQQSTPGQKSAGAPRSTYPASEGDDSC